jgi:hypothetical protein
MSNVIPTNSHISTRPYYISFHSVSFKVAKIKTVHVSESHRAEIPALALLLTSFVTLENPFASLILLFTSINNGRWMKISPQHKYFTIVCFSNEKMEGEVALAPKSVLLAFCTSWCLFIFTTLLLITM